jgi:hypothetical protein
MLLVVVQIETADRRCVFWAQAEIVVVQAEGIEILPQLLAEASMEEIALL